MSLESSRHPFLHPSYIFYAIVWLIIGIIAITQILAPKPYDSATIRAHLGETMTISGKLVSDPDTSSGATTTINLKSPDLGLFYVTLSGASHDLLRSDNITIRGKLTQGFGNFSGTFYRAELLDIAREYPGDIFARFKNFFSNLVRAHIPSPESGLGLGYLVGAKNGIEPSLSESLQLVGMTHIVVASGAHLSIIVDFIKKIFGKISRFAATFMSLIIIVAFVGVVGFTPSMTRAALVVVLGLLVGYTGRSFTPMRLIALVAMITLIISPSNITNLGWQLSFASFFGILVLAPRLTRTFYGGKNPPRLAWMILSSLSTALTCAPILIYNFGTFSLLSFVANLIILPTLPFAMLLVLATGATSFLPFLADIIGFAATCLLRLHIWVINFLSQQTSFILSFAPNNPVFFLLYLPILAYLCYNMMHEYRSKPYYRALHADRA